MLQNLKRELNKTRDNDMILEAAAKGAVEDNFKDAILNDLNFIVMGAEKDPEIRSLIESIPEYDEDDEDVQNEIDSLTESLLETEF